MRKLLAITVMLAACATGLTAQVLKPVKWEISSRKAGAGIYDIICKAKIEAAWHLYDSRLPEGGPLPTTFNIDEEESNGVELTGGFKATAQARTEHSEAFDMDLKYFVDTVTFVQRIKVTQPKAKLTGYIEFMACTGGQCTPPTEADFNFELSK